AALGCRPRIRRAECLRHTLERGQPLPDGAIRALSGGRLDAAHTGPDRAVGDEHEAADLAGRLAVGPAAQLAAVSVDLDDPDLFAVLLVEERIGTRGDRLAHRHEARGHRPVLAHDPADLVLDRPFLVGRHGPVARIVEAEAIGRHERARLAGAGTDDIAQGAVEDMGPRVVAARGRAALRVDLGEHGVADVDRAVQHAVMDDHASRELLGILDRELDLAVGTVAPEHPAISDLAAALWIERRDVEHDLGGTRAAQLAVLGSAPQDRLDATRVARRLVAHEAGRPGAPRDLLEQLGALR